MERIGVVGCGLMGAGIAEVAARAGIDVIVIEQNVDAINAGRDRIEKSLTRASASGKLSDEEAALARENLHFSEKFGDLADVQFAIEAVSEKESIKLEVFKTLDAVVQDPGAILATNTSSIPIIKLAMATRQPVCQWSFKEESDHLP